MKPADKEIDAPDSMRDSELDSDEEEKVQPKESEQERTDQKVAAAM